MKLIMNIKLQTFATLTTLIAGLLLSGCAQTIKPVYRDGDQSTYQFSQSAIGQVLADANTQCKLTGKRAKMIGQPSCGNDCFRGMCDVSCTANFECQ